MKTLLLCLLPALIYAKPAAKPTTAALDRLQASWDETKSFDAEFTQTIHSKGAGLPDEPASGTLSVTKPNQLRWEDRTSKVTQLIDGDEYWEITENRRKKNRTVTYSKGLQKKLGGTAFSILVGKGKFKDFYKVKLVSDTDKEAILSLTPLTETNETLIAKIDKNGYVLRSLTTESPDSKVVLEFSQIRRNPSFEPERFRYVKQASDIFQTRKE
jgi:outer membrane lipoprotein-sorting protein